MFYKLIQGDCIEVLKTFPDESIDCCVTDPPYGISFMGKKWDEALPPKEAFEQIYRVLKSGALAFVMSSPRQDVLWRMLQMLEGCGFQLRQSFVSWIYKSGFPKAYDLSLGIDKKFIRQEFVAEHGRKPTKDELKVLLKEKRKTVGYKIVMDGAKRDPSKHKSPAELSNIGKWGLNKTPHGLPITQGYTKEAQEWEGWKSITGLKPALECILMVNKPLSEKTIVDNVLKHGTGAINVDACRIPFQGEVKFTNRTAPKSNGTKMGLFNENTKLATPTEKGRFPANLICSDKALDTGKTTKSSGGSGEATWNTQLGESGIYHKYTNRKGEGLGGYGDVGDQSRYFDLDAWARHHGFLDVPKASKSEREQGLEGLEKKDCERTNQNWKCKKCGKFQLAASGIAYLCKCKHPIWERPQQQNFHPTVKPVKLMAYLIELGCPPNGVVLDPFLGSGTTMIASQRLGRSCIGIELNPEYCLISKARCFPTQKQLLAEYVFEVFEEDLNTSPT